MDDPRFLKVKLDDAIIKATNEDGQERLRLAIKVAGVDVLVRFPTYGNWDFYYSDLAKLLMIMAQTANDIELNAELVPDKHFKEWAYLVSQVLKYKECKQLVEKIFFEYLRPEVPGIEPGKTKEWLEKNMDISHLFYMFTSILHIDEWFKKKSAMVLQTTFPNLTQPSLTDTSPKISTSKSIDSQPGLPFEFA